MAAIASRRLAAVRSVPDTDRRRPSGSTFAPSERGKNSYQDPNSARCRSTTSGHHPDVVVNSRNGKAASVGATWAINALPGRSTVVPWPPRSVLATLSYSARAAAAGSAVLDGSAACSSSLAARSNSSAPSVSIRATSWPIGTLIAASCRQCAIGSPHASTLKCQSPSLVGVTSAPYLSVPSASPRIVTIGRQLPAGSRSTTPAPSISWPSRNTVAVTGRLSPVTALAGRCPHATMGSMSRMGILPITTKSYPIVPDGMHADGHSGAANLPGAPGATGGLPGPYPGARPGLWYLLVSARI